MFARIRCWITNHDMLPDKSSRSYALKCTHCGHRTPGWDVTPSYKLTMRWGRARGKVTPA